ncbi:MAG TPA: response regulator transcription factor [Tepidisphaeraceae bacterium]|jgi:DNA-binding NarL/FixJ family response regulator|nr:response regulator transcription factor [Tepidisphaeraceae bacterium]
MRILIADDHQMFRQGLRLLLDSQPDVEVVAETGDGRSAVQLAAEHSPDVIVMDVSMPDLNGIDATRQILTNAPAGKAPKVIALSAHSDHHFAEQMLAAGACGYVLKHAAFPEMIEALSAVLAGKVYVSPTLPNIAKDLAANAVNDASATGKLSPREREILQLLAEGKAMKEIAAVLGVSIKTVETHRRTMMSKLSLYSVAELTKYAIREGVTSLETPAG